MFFQGAHTSMLYVHGQSGNMKVYTKLEKNNLVFTEVFHPKVQKEQRKWPRPNKWGYIYRHDVAWDQWPRKASDAPSKPWDSIPPQHLPNSPLVALATPPNRLHFGNLAWPAGDKWTLGHNSNVCRDSAGSPELTVLTAICPSLPRRLSSHYAPGSALARKLKTEWTSVSLLCISYPRLKRIIMLLQELHGTRMNELALLMERSSHLMWDDSWCFKKSLFFCF